MVPSQPRPQGWGGALLTQPLLPEMDGCRRISPWVHPSSNCLIRLFSGEDSESGHALM